MRVLSFRVREEDWEAFQRCAARQGIEPYRALRAMVEAWAGAERLARMLEGGGSSLDALSEFAQLAQEIKTVFKLNGELATAVKALAERYGLRLDLEALWRAREEPSKEGSQSGVMGGQNEA